ncbi:MAG: arginine repressor, partial [Acidobacteria bacterium]
MTSKNARRTRILELVRRHQVGSQEELAVLLERAGI